MEKRCCVTTYGIKHAQTRAHTFIHNSLSTLSLSQVRVGKRALEHGLLCRFDPHWLAFGPALNSSAGDIDAMTEILDRSLGEVLAEVQNEKN